MLFMDHLSADLLCENLPGDQEGIRVINIHIGLNNNRETNRTMDTQSCVYVTPSHCLWLNNCQIKLLQVVSHSIYYSNNFIKLINKGKNRKIGQEQICSMAANLTLECSWTQRFLYETIIFSFQSVSAGLECVCMQGTDLEQHIVGCHGEVAGVEHQAFSEQREEAMTQHDLSFSPDQDIRKSKVS